PVRSMILPGMVDHAKNPAEGDVCNADPDGHYHQLRDRRPMTACLSADVQVSCREQGVQAGDRESQEFTVQEAKDDTRNTCIPKDIKEHPSVISLDDHPETKTHRKQYCTVPDIAEDQPKEDGEYDRDNEGGIELVVLRPGIHIDQELARLHKIDVIVLHGREILSL